MRKHHKEWNVEQLRHCTVVLLYLVVATGRHRTVTELWASSFLFLFSLALDSCK